MARAAAIILKDGAAALIKRVRQDKTYFLFPGGTVEEGETFEQAYVREIEEELGLIVSVDREIERIVFNDKEQRYYICNVISGNFGSGTGPEYQPGLPEERGTYEPVWMPVDELTANDVRPRHVCEMVVHGYLDRPKS